MLLAKVTPGTVRAGVPAVRINHPFCLLSHSRCSAQAYLLGGAQLSGSFVDLYQLKGNIDQAYAFPAFHFDLHLCRANLPPHTAVRGPGEIQVLFSPLYFIISPFCSLSRRL